MHSSAGPLLSLVGGGWLGVGRGRRRWRGHWRLPRQILLLWRQWRARRCHAHGLWISRMIQKVRRLHVAVWTVLLMLGSWLSELRHLVEVCLLWLLRWLGQAAKVLVLCRMRLILRIGGRIELIPSGWPLASRAIRYHLLILHHLLVGATD